MAAAAALRGMQRAKLHPLSSHRCLRGAVNHALETNSLKTISRAISSSNAGKFTVRVHALSVASRIDLKTLHNAIRSIDQEGEELRGSRWYPVELNHRDWLHFSLRPLHDELVPTHASSHGRTRQAYASINKRGSVVFTNCDLADAIYLLDVLHGLESAGSAGTGGRATTSRSSSSWSDSSSGSRIIRPLLPQSFVGAPPSSGASPSASAASASAAPHRTLDSLTLLVDPSLGSWVDPASSARSSSSRGNALSDVGSSGGGAMLVRVRRLDPASVSTIADVLAMSVTLQEHEMALGPLGEAVADLNDALATTSDRRSGRSGISQQQQLLRPEVLHSMLAECSRITADLTLSHVSDVPRPGSPAWADERLSHLHALLVDEFDVAARRDDLEHRLAHVTKLVKDAVEQRRSAQMVRLDWLIVLILAIDCVLLLLKNAKKRRLAREAPALADAEESNRLDSSSPSGAQLELLPAR